MSPVAAAVASACKPDGAAEAGVVGCVVLCGVVVGGLGAVVGAPDLAAVPPQAAVASTATAGNKSRSTCISREASRFEPESRLNADSSLHDTWRREPR